MGVEDEVGGCGKILKGTCVCVHAGIVHVLYLTVFSYSRALQSYDIAQVWVLLHRPWGTLHDILAINMFLLELMHLKGEKKHGAAVVS